MTTKSSSAEPRSRRRKPEMVFPLNTRVAPAYRELIDEVAERENLTIRDVVEQAIEAKWGRSA